MSKEFLEMIVEIPTGSSNKYEFDQFEKKWKLDRVLYGSMFYPAEYGYIEKTIDFDGDPLDVLCVVSKPTFQGCRIPLKVIGLLKMIDQGQEDHKIIAVPSEKVDPRFSNINSINDLGHKSFEIVDFFKNYKNLENKEVFVEGFLDSDQAFKILDKCRKMFLKVENKISSGASNQEIINIINSFKE